MDRLGSCHITTPRAAEVYGTGCSTHQPRWCRRTRARWHGSLTYEGRIWAVVTDLRSFCKRIEAARNEGHVKECQACRRPVPSEEFVSLDIHVCICVRIACPPLLCLSQSVRNVLAYLTNAGSMARAVACQLTVQTPYRIGYTYSLVRDPP